MKISVPWPAKQSSQIRIKESLSLWTNKENILICLVEPCNDEFLNDFYCCLLERNSSDIGTSIPKCYIHDMIKKAIELFPTEDWYGFGNSDCVPVGNLLENYNDYEVLVFHRTNIKDWSHRFFPTYDKEKNKDLMLKIWKMRQEGISDKKIAKQLNRSKASLPEGYTEWTYDLIRKLFFDQGTVFFWGQDMYLFRRDIVDKVLKDYLLIVDPILGTGGFDPRLTKWCLDNFKGARVLNKIFHKEHPSEWNINEIEYKHNGGDIVLEERTIFYNETFVQNLCEQGQKGAIPRYIKYLIGKDNPELKKVLVAK